MKKTNKAKTATTNKNASTAKRVVNNIGKYPNGIYRVRKMIDGVNYTETFSSLTRAKKYLKSL